VIAVFDEFQIRTAGKDFASPGMRKLEVSIAGRYEKTHDFKDRYNPQYWLRWAPGSWVEIRGSWGRSSQAPLLTSFNTSRNSIVLSPVADAQSPTGESDALVLSGNKPQLTEETATTASVGLGL